MHAPMKLELGSAEELAFDRWLNENILRVELTAQSRIDVQQTRPNDDRCGQRDGPGPSWLRQDRPRRLPGLSGLSTVGGRPRFRRNEAISCQGEQSVG